MSSLSDAKSRIVWYSRLKPARQPGAPLTQPGAGQARGLAGGWYFPQWRLQTLGYGTAGLVGYARIEQNGHHASDVVAGAILGYAITRSIVHRHDRPNPNRISWTPYTDGIRTGIVFYQCF